MGLRRIAWRLVLAAGAALVVVVPAAVAASVGMHSVLGARLSGMGEHGVVNLQSEPKKGKLCWAFDLPATKGVTGASIHQGAKGVLVVSLGKIYAAKGCTQAAGMALEHVESAPGSYSVWVDTKGHPGDLRGKLFVGMAHM